MGLIVTGCSLLVLTLISIICGGVVISKVTIPKAIYNVGLWGHILFVLPLISFFICKSLFFVLDRRSLVSLWSSFDTISISKSLQGKYSRQF